LVPFLVTAFMAVMVLGIPQHVFAQAAASAPVFGPQTYTRTTGAPNEYNDDVHCSHVDRFTYNLHIVNGDASGKNRVSSATIALNGVQIAGPSDFNQNVATIDRSVALQATNTPAGHPGEQAGFLSDDQRLWNKRRPHGSPDQDRYAGGRQLHQYRFSEYRSHLRGSAGNWGARSLRSDVSTIKATLDGVDRTTCLPCDRAMPVQPSRRIWR